MTDIVTEARRVADYLDHVISLAVPKGVYTGAELSAICPKDEQSQEAAHLLRSLADIVARLPVTADGVILTEGAHNLFALYGNRSEVRGPYHSTMRFDFSGPEQWHRPEDCYSTRAAAESAAKEGA